MKRIIATASLALALLTVGCATFGCADLGQNWWGVEPPLDNVPSNTTTNAPLIEVTP